MNQPKAKAIKWWKCDCPEYNNHSIGALPDGCRKCGAKEPHVALLAEEDVPTKTVIDSLYFLANDIQSYDGVANSAMAQAARRMERLQKEHNRMHEYIEKQDCMCGTNFDCRRCILLKSIHNS